MKLKDAEELQREQELLLVEIQTVKLKHSRLANATRVLVQAMREEAKSQEKLST
jgi:hypothetical protein